MAQAQALIYWLALTKMGTSGAKITGLRGLTGSLGNCLAMAPELPEVKKHLNAL